MDLNTCNLKFTKKNLHFKIFFFTSTNFLKNKFLIFSKSLFGLWQPVRQKTLLSSSFFFPKPFWKKKKNVHDRDLLIKLIWHSFLTFLRKSLAVPISSSPWHSANLRHVSRGAVEKGGKEGGCGLTREGNIIEEVMGFIFGIEDCFIFVSSRVNFKEVSDYKEISGFVQLYVSLIALLLIAIQMLVHARVHREKRNAFVWQKLLQLITT